MKLSNSALAAAASGPESAASSLAPGAATMDHPFAELIGLQVLEQAAGRSTLQLSIQEPVGLGERRLRIDRSGPFLTVLLLHSQAMGLQVRQELSSLGPILAIDAPSPTGSQAHHLNPHRVAHGAVLYALADTGMGAALYPTLAEGELCATIEIKISYFKPVRGGMLVCRTELVNRGKRVANLESRLYLGELLVAQANGHFAIFKAAAAAP